MNGENLNTTLFRLFCARGQIVAVFRFTKPRHEAHHTRVIGNAAITRKRLHEGFAGDQRRLALRVRQDLNIEIQGLFYGYHQLRHIAKTLRLKQVQGSINIDDALNAQTRILLELMMRWWSMGNKTQGI